MWMDAVDLRDFYATSLGHAARRIIGRQIRSVWPGVKGMNVLGLGYATPFLNSFRSEAARVAAAMPAAQGVLHWPLDGRSQTVLCREDELPFEDMSMDRVLLVHGLECTEQVRPMMREIWRILNGGGRLLVVVPNRSGLWARFERTPFGHGRPYSPGQISRLLRENMFTPDKPRGALFVPPTRSRMVLSSAPAWEEIGHRWFTTFAGVVLAEATKQIYAAPIEAAKAAKKSALGLAPKNTGAPTRG